MLYSNSFPCIFYSGNRYWRFNHASKSAYTGTYEGVNWPVNGRLISEGWPAKSGSNTRIPDNIDAAYYDKRDNNYYFFKGSQVSLLYLVLNYLYSLLWSPSYPPFFRRIQSCCFRFRREPHCRC